MVEWRPPKETDGEDKEGRENGIKPQGFWIQQ